MLNGGVAAPRGRFVLPLGIALCFFLGIESGGQQISLLYIADEFHLTNAAMGTIVTVQFLAIVIMPALFGRAGGKAGKKKTLLAAVATLLLGCIMTSSARSVFFLGIGIFIIGTGFSVSESFMMAALADHHPAQSGRHVNLAQGFFSLGCVISPVWIDSLIKTDGASWRIAFIIAACSCAALVPLLLFAQFKPAGAGSETPSASPVSYASFFKNKVFAAALIALFCYVGIEAGFVYYANSLFTIRLSMPQLGAYALSAFWAAMAAMRILFGVIKTDPGRTVIISMASAAALFAVTSFCTLPVLSLILCGLAGGFMAPTWPMLMSMGIGKNAAQSGTASGMLMSGGGLGGMAVPFVMGIAADRFNLSASVFILAVMSAFCALLIFGANIRKARSP